MSFPTAYGGDYRVASLLVMTEKGAFRDDYNDRERKGKEIIFHFDTTLLAAQKNKAKISLPYASV